MRVTARILIDIPVEEKQWLKRLVEREKSTMIGLLRKALDEYREKYHPDYPERPGKNENS
jgi:hypothetical protein